jgi:DNA modification methylase
VVVVSTETVLPPTATKAPVCVYESEWAEVWLGDARDVLAAVGTESAGLVVTDPPYGVEWCSNWRTQRFDQLVGDGDSVDERAIVSDVIEQLVRVVGQHRHLYVFGPADVLENQKVSEVVELIWDKGVMGSGDVTSVWGPQHERINFCTSKFRHAGKSGTSTLPTRMRKGSVLRFNRPTGRKVRHPSEKPVDLLCELIESSSRRGDLVVDAFAGTGSTGVAAILTGRRTLLIEKDPQWTPLIVERIREAERIAAQMRSA